MSPCDKAVGADEGTDTDKKGATETEATDTDVAGAAKPEKGKSNKGAEARAAHQPPEHSAAGGDKRADAPGQTKDKPAKKAGQAK